MDLSNLHGAAGSAHSDNFRRGRGHGSGNGKTAGKGHKGQKARSGAPRPGFEGHCWIVEEVDWKRHTVFATQVKGRVPAYFGDCPGDINTHVLERMRKALNEHAAYPYLMGNARARLAQARHTAEISGAGTKPLINLGGDTWVLFPWLGSYAFLALERMLKIKCAAELGLRGLDPSRPYFMQFKIMRLVAHCRQLLRERGEEFDPNTPFGVMFGVPSACLTAEEFVERGCNFFVIETNDLTQYTHAVDRDISIAERYYRPASHAMKKLIRMVVEAAREGGIPVTICGSAVGNPANTLQYLQLGLRSFSVSPQNLIEVKKALMNAKIK